MELSPSIHRFPHVLDFAESLSSHRRIAVQKISDALQRFFGKRITDLVSAIRAYVDDAVLRRVLEHRAEAVETEASDDQRWLQMSYRSDQARHLLVILRLFTREAVNNRPLDIKVHFPGPAQ